MPATVERLEYDPNRTGFIALIKYQDGELAYILAPQRLAAGDSVIASEHADVKPGNAMGIGEGVADRKKVDNAANDLSLIAGQKAVITKSRKSIATYKLRDGQAIGCKVTLRKARMYDFIDRLVNIALPRVRDFRGLNPKSFDGRGNYSLGIKEYTVFPEIDFDKVTDTWGLDITVCTSARNDEEARALLTAFNFPFRQ